MDLDPPGAGIFERPKDIDDFNICPTHRSNLGTGVGWSRGFISRCIKKCTAMVKVRLSRFQMPIGELASVYHRKYARKIHITIPCAKLRVPSD